jgi:hypothetical protein
MITSLVNTFWLALQHLLPLALAALLSCGQYLNGGARCRSAFICLRRGWG